MRKRSQTASDAGALSEGHRRRGAIAVMTAVFIVVIMLVTAVSIDASRIFVAKNELQTAADAAALAGAVQLLEDSSTATDSAGSYVARNRVGADSIVTVEIAPGVWHPTDRTFELAGPPWNAVRVITRHSLPLSLARVLGDSAVTVTASAVAWSFGPVPTSGCAKPIAVPYGRLLETLGYPSWTNMDLTEDDIERLREMSPRDIDTLRYSSSPDDTTWSSYPNDDEYFPVDIDSSWSRGDPLTHGRDSVSGNSFRSYVVGPPTGRCSRTVQPGDLIRSEPGNKLQAIEQGLDSLCTLRGGDFDGNRCSREDGTRVDIPLKVVFWEDYGGASWDDNPNRALLRARMTGSFMFTELWPLSETDLETRGALVGYFDVMRDYGEVVESSPSTLLRPVLVQ
jgi:hypothetical protein